MSILTYKHASCPVINSKVLEITAVNIFAVSWLCSLESRLKHLDQHNNVEFSNNYHHAKFRNWFKTDVKIRKAAVISLEQITVILT